MDIITLIRVRLARKAALFTLSIIVVTGLIWFFLLRPYFESISSESVVWTVIIIMLLALYIFIHYFLNPLNVILKQVRALLTGRPYNRIFTKRIDEIGIVAHFFNEITRALERVSKDLKDQRRMSAELEIARNIQRDILPKEAPLIDGLNVLLKTKSAVEIGGDSFDFIEKGENTFIYIGDVTGHGVPSGLVMMMVDTLINTFTDMYERTDEILIHTNKYLKPRLSPTMFMTMLLFRFHHPTKKMYVSGAGHEHILIYKKSDQMCKTEASGGIALGMVQDMSNMVSEREISFEEGDILVAYSDGISEAKNLNGEMFGLKRLKTILEEAGKMDLNVSKIFEIFTKSFEKFRQNHVQEDDMTIIIIKHKRPQDEHTFTGTAWGKEEIFGESLLHYE
ncbi:SpoIIE family protein phosphatase [Candidatus Peregrinibacteria bacterium]|nr:SpoIIE family protein phosphatase [Candidatus Peregrinibacteria bacterium]